MGGLVGGGGAQSAGGSGRGGSVYTPANQPQADQAYSGIVSNLFPYANNPSTTPGGQAYQQAQPYLTNYLQDPGTQQRAVTGSTQASDYYGNTLFPSSDALSRQIIGSGFNFLNQAQNPYYPQAQNAAGVASQIGQGTATQGLQSSADVVNAAQQLNPYTLQAGNRIAGASDPLQGLGSSISSAAAGAGGDIYGEASKLKGLPQSVIGSGWNSQDVIQQKAAPLEGLSSALISSGFDPQRQLYDKLRQQTLNTANVGNAFSGVGNTPYGQSVTDQAATNFDINWENQQLARQAQAAQAASGVQGQIGNLLAQGAGVGQAGAQIGSGIENLIGGMIGQGQGVAQSGANTAANLQNTIANILKGGVASDVLGTQGAASLYGTGQDLGSNAASLYAQSGNLPANTYNQNLQQQLGLTQGGAGLAGTGLNLGTQGAQGLSTFSGLPYNTEANIASTVLGGLGSGTTLGNNQFAIPQQVLNDLQSYLGLGQSASVNSANVGNLGFQQGAQSLQGLGAGANLLFGNSLGQGGGLLGAAGLNPLTSGGGLFGGTAAGSNALLDTASTGAFLPEEIFGAGAADVGAAGAAGGGFLDALPAAASIP